MSKKSFQSAPKPKQPTAEDIAAFERGGAGHDAVAPNVGSPKPAKAAPEPTKRLSLDVPEIMHTRFKTACSATSRKMVAEIMEFIERRTAELEASAGIHR
jgi:hypothetical protein